MKSYTDDLDDYKSYPATKSCYLDGRYFNKVFQNYPGLITQPFNIIVNQTDERMTVRYYMSEAEINNSYPGLLRVIVNTPEGRHSSLLIIDYTNKKIFRFDPYGRSSPYFDAVNDVIKSYFSLYLDFELYNIENPKYDQKNPTCVQKGVDTGFCVAYIIKYAYDYLNNRVFDPTGILNFAGLIEQMYGPFPAKGKDVEYGLFGGGNNPNTGRNVATGVLGGALVGGLLTGSAGGAIAGGLGGGLIGGML